MDQSQTLYSIDMSTSFWEEFGGIIIGILAGLAVIVLTIATCGVAAIVGATISITVGSVVMIAATAVGTGLVVGTYYSNEFLPDDLSLPMYSISAEEIFRGDIALFDVNFFKPKEIYVKTNDSANHGLKNYKLTDEGKKYRDQNLSSLNDEEAVDQICLRNDLYHTGTSGLSTEGIEAKNRNQISDADFKRYVEEIPNRADNLTDEQIESKDILYYYYIDDNGEEVVTSRQNTAYELRSVISSWYNALRNIALVLMMSILLYIGIRMLLSSIASDKAKYKQMLIDWVVGMCLLFFMHYIMAFSNTIVYQLVEVVKTTYDSSKYSVTIQADENHKIAEQLKEAGKTDVFYPEGTTDPDDVEYIVWPSNLMGRMRIELQMHTGNVNYIGYAICYIVLVFYTVFFAFTYLKRVIYMAFLTMISPMVAMTYPIDKINDGQAQGFNKWLKEYIFNLLIQPLHLLLYTILVSSAFEFAGKNVWYMIVAIGFLIPAEKLLRNFFGFEKASTPGSLAGAAVGAGLVSRGMGSLLHKMPHGEHKRIGKGGSEKGQSDDKENSPRMKFKPDEIDSTDAILSGEDGSNSDLALGVGLGAGLGAGLGEGNGDNNDKEKASRISFKNNTENNGNLLRNATNKNIDRLATNAKKVQIDKPKKEDSKLDGKKDKKVQTNRNLPSKSKRIKRALKAGGRRVFSSGNRRKLSNIAKKGIRFTSGAALATAAGTIGVAAGVASGDASNALQYGLAGVGAGAAAGAKLSGAAMNTVGYAKDKLNGAQQGISGTVEDMKKAYYEKDEYNQKQMDKQIKKIKKNKEYRQELEDAMGIDKAEEIYENGELEKCLRYGIDDAKDIAAIQQLQELPEKDGGASNIEQAIAIHKYAKVAGDTTKMKAKDRKEWTATYKERFLKAGLPEDRADEESEKTLKKLDAYNNIKFNL